MQAPCPAGPYQTVPDFHGVASILIVLDIFMTRNHPTITGPDGAAKVEPFPLAFRR